MITLFLRCLLFVLVLLLDQEQTSLTSQTRDNSLYRYFMTRLVELDTIASSTVALGIYRVVLSLLLHVKA